MFFTIPRTSYSLGYFLFPKVYYPTSFGTDKIFCYASHPKIGVLVVIHAKNDAKEEEEEKEEKEEEKENVGIFSPNLSFFGNQKNLKRELNLNFF